MRRLLKFLHTIGGAGLFGAAAALLLLIHAAGAAAAPPSHAWATIQEEAARAADALASGPDPAAFAGEEAMLWVVIALCAANVALGVWRPRLGGRRGG